MNLLTEHLLFLLVFIDYLGFLCGWRCEGGWKACFMVEKSKVLLCAAWYTWREFELGRLYVIRWIKTHEARNVVNAVRLKPIFLLQDLIWLCNSYFLLVLGGGGFFIFGCSKVYIVRRAVCTIFFSLLFRVCLPSF